VRELSYKIKYEARSVGIRRKRFRSGFFYFGGLQYPLARALGK